MDRAVTEIASDRGFTMDLWPETSQSYHADDRTLPRIDGEGMRMQLDVRCLVIPDVKLIRTPRLSDARGYFSETFQRADFAAQGLDNDFSRTISRAPISWEPFAACTFNGRLSLRRSWFACCAGAFSMSLLISAVRHRALEGT